MFRNYYHYLIAGLPEVFFESSDIQFKMTEYKMLLKDQLKPKDYELIKTLFLVYDNDNFLSFLKEEKDNFNPLGNFSYSEFENEFLVEKKNILPSYFYKFYEIYKDPENNQKINKSWENIITEMYYEYVLLLKNVFIKEWFEFNQNIRNLLTGLNCRKFNFIPEKHLIGNNEITKAILTNNSRDFGLAMEFPVVNEILSLSEKEDFLISERDLDILRWKKLEDLTLFEYFSIEKVMSYTIKLDIVYRWLAIDEEKGRAIFKQLITDIKSGFEFSKEFTIK